MGMDVYGLAPKTKGEKPTIDWSLKPSDEESKAYFDAKDIFEKENVGYYFRNNVWWWRPLLDYVYQLNDDILTEEDYEHGHFNDGHEITEEQYIQEIKLIDDDDEPTERKRITMYG